MKAVHRVGCSNCINVNEWTSKYPLIYFHSLFLVRESSSVPGVFVLSFCMNLKVYHCQLVEVGAMEKY